MSKERALIVTGGAGFIGSNIVNGLNEDGRSNIFIVDHLTEAKRKNLDGLLYRELYDAQDFLKLVRNNQLPESEAIFHMGARTDTAESDRSFMLRNNTLYSKELFEYCVRNDTRLIYASSAATYGDGGRGYNDQERNLQPLNVYGYSKYAFDEMVLNSLQRPLQWVGLKFFNVYGPNEYHKGNMASVVFRGFNQVMNDGYLRLFKSYRPEFSDGGQLRDFIYVKDVVKIALFFFHHPEQSGIYNVGTGKARTFLDLARAIFLALRREPKIVFIDMPEAIRENYQYSTEADTTNLRGAGYTDKFFDIEVGVKDYVQRYLLPRSPASNSP